MAGIGTMRRRRERRARGLWALCCLSLWVCLGGLLAPRASAAPYGVFNRAQDDWKVTETEHFRFYFTDSTPHTLAYLLQIAEPTLARLAALYGEQPPGKITVTIVGYTSYANGFADSQHNRITIFPSPPNFHSRTQRPGASDLFSPAIALRIRSSGSVSPITPVEAT